MDLFSIFLRYLRCPVVKKVRNMLFLSPLVLSKSENLALLSLYTFWGKCVYFSILNDKIHNYVKQTKDLALLSFEESLLKCGCFLIIE